VFDQNGKLINEFGEGLYALTYAQSVRVDRQDNIWIVDQYSNMVVKFDPEGRVLMTFGRRPETASSITANVGAGAARGAAAGGAGAAAPARGAAAPAAGATRGGEVPAPPAGAAAAPAATAPAAARGAAAPQGGAAPRGRGAAGAGSAGDSFNRPTDVAWDAAGNIFITDGFGTNSRVLKMDKNGKFVKTFGGTGSDNGQFNKPASIAIDAKGDVYVADKANNRIQVFNNDGVFKSQFTNVGTPSAICISPGAHQYLFSSNSNDADNLERGEIYKMELDGTIVGKFGSAGHLVKEFGMVNSLDCPSENTVFVGELYNWRVQKVTLRK
jgi:DNA-binding beta-propeller fold protein YncE